MIWLRHRWLPLTALVAATTALVATILWAASATSTGGWPAGSMMGPAGDGPVSSLADAQTAAGRFAQRWGLRVGEVMQFDNGFYAELRDPAGNSATEVLIDPDTGTVGLEWGPAMMWNIAYGMHPAARGTCTLDPDQAKRIADQWLQGHRLGEHADAADAFPGYYTLHTLRGDQVVGMLSVHCATGSVWHHDWHGRLLQMHEPDTQ
ncbi:hypothetical protein [Qaidamihabitans albus]|uniref:hypothetical protein n=1 Tax=Qaidamihabitans albus TaxID=2795733 RepID=UPI0018F11815|nr:hypothetical protein [Qaidamihabitans albus]